MASIRFSVRGNANPSKITARLMIDGETDYRRTIPVFINPRFFNNKTGKVRQIASFKDKDSISNTLKAFEVGLFQQFNKTIKAGGVIDSNWLKTFIDEYFNLIEKNDLSILVNYCEIYIKDLRLKRNERTGEIGVSKATVTKYNTLKNKVVAFEKYKRRKYQLTDVNLNFRNEFLAYLLDIDKISNNTAGRYLGFLKTVCLHAQQNGQRVSVDLPKVRGFKVKTKHIYLTLDEIETIQGTNYDKKHLDTARDWLVIGCFIGQRVSDLLSLTKRNLTMHNGRDFIELIQQKTKKRISILIPPPVLELLNKYNWNFPPSYSSNPQSATAVFNLHIKEVARKAKLNTIVSGVGKMNPETSRKEVGNYPKWELVTSHICRRSFASNFYDKMPLPLLMNITGHATERQFLEYIGKTPLDYADQTAIYWDKIFRKEKNEVILRKVN